MVDLHWLLNFAACERCVGWSVLIVVVISARSQCAAAQAGAACSSQVRGMELPGSAEGWGAGVPV